MTRPHPAVGIDLGTTYSAVAFVDGMGRAETIRSSEGGLTTPSAIFLDRSSPVIGIEAMAAGLDEPQPSEGPSKRPLRKLTRKAKPRSESGSGGWKSRRRKLAPGNDEAS